MNITKMTISDYDEVFSLWQNIEKMCIDDCDSYEGIANYLRRNPNLSL